MGALGNLLMGIQIALQPANFSYCFIGVFIGTLIGVLPGVGPLAGISLLLPLTYGMNATSAIILLAGIYYGAQYGGSTTSILMNVPGEVSSIVTCLDGHQMALRGRAGPALGIAAFGSFIAGTLGTLGLMLIANPLAKIALKFGPPEFFSLMVLGIIVLTSISRGSVVKGLIMAAFGFVLSFIGIDSVGGGQRFTFGLTHLTSGLDLGPLAIGFFGVSEIMISMEESVEDSFIKIKMKLKDYFPSLKDWRDSKGPILRGTVLGFLVGTIPGGGAILASFASYAVEKRLSRHPEKFGSGAIEGVAGPESANNSASSGAFIPLLTMGIPSNVITALLLGALMIHGVQPGPLFLSEHSDIFWGVIGSMYIGNVMLLILNIPLIPLWVQLLRVPPRILYPLILLFCILGSYSVNNNILDVYVMILCGVTGYVLRKLEYEIAPLCLAFVLGPILENSFRQSLLISDGSFGIFVTRPIAGLTLLISALLLAFSWTKRNKIYVQA
jgi:putative tricarboxylic transport membrane protein